MRFRWLTEMSLNKDWRTKAICQRLPESYLSWFFADKDTIRTRSAQRLCFEQCPVRENCLLFALDMGLESGVFGGLRPDDRSGIGVKGYSKRKERVEQVRIEVETYFINEMRHRQSRI